jgi:hypothetical protein
VLAYIPLGVYARDDMKIRELQHLLQEHPNSFPRFVLPDGSYIPPHAHVTEVGHVVRNFIDCGGLVGKEEQVVLQTHVGSDTDHRLRSDRFAKILQLGERVLPTSELDINVEYDCCVVSQYPIREVRVEGEQLDLILERAHTQCRARERIKAEESDPCCILAAACC